MQRTEAIALAARLAREGRDAEAIIAALKERGVSILDTIAVFREVEGLSLGEAKAKVHFSRAWAAEREGFDRLHETATSAAEHLDFSTWSAEMPEQDCGMVEECTDRYEARRRVDGGLEISISVPPRFAALWLVKLSNLRATDAEIEEYEGE